MTDTQEPQNTEESAGAESNPPLKNHSTTEEVKKPWGIDVKSFNVLLHLAQFAGMMVPFAGIALPLVMWLTNKDEFPSVDEHGKQVANWLISSTIYIVISSLLILLLVGFVLLPVVLLLNFIFVIIGAVKAGNGEVWQYPLSIKFFK